MCVLVTIFCKAPFAAWKIKTWHKLLDSEGLTHSHSHTYTYTYAHTQIPLTGCPLSRLTAALRLSHGARGRRKAFRILSMLSPSLSFTHSQAHLRGALLINFIRVDFARTFLKDFSPVNRPSTHWAIPQQAFTYYGGHKKAYQRLKSPLYSDCDLKFVCNFIIYCGFFNRKIYYH